MKKKLVVLGMITALLLTGCGDSEEDLKIRAWVCGRSCGTKFKISIKC